MATQLDTAGHGIDALWAEYKKTGAKALRDQLIVHYAPVVKYVAGRVSVGLPRHVDEADLASYGIIGLIDAIERFEPARNIKFETYAVPRIKGAIIDELALHRLGAPVGAGQGPGRRAVVRQARGAPCTGRRPTPRWPPTSR